MSCVVSPLLHKYVYGPLPVIPVTANLPQLTVQFEVLTTQKPKSTDVLALITAFSVVALAPPLSIIVA